MRNNGISHDGEYYSVASLKDAASEMNGNKNKNNPSIKYYSSRKSRPIYRDVFRLNSMTKVHRSLLILDYFEQQLVYTNTRFLIQDRPTYIDLALFYILFEPAETDNVPVFNQRFDLPLLGQ